MEFIKRTPEYYDKLLRDILSGRNVGKEQQIMGEGRESNLINYNYYNDINNMFGKVKDTTRETRNYSSNQPKDDSKDILEITRKLINLESNRNMTMHQQSEYLNLEAKLEIMGYRHLGRGQLKKL